MAHWLTLRPIAALALASAWGRQDPLPHEPAAQDLRAIQAPPTQPIETQQPPGTPTPETPTSGTSTPETPAPVPARPISAYEPRYHSLDEVEALVRAWIAEAPPEKVLVERVDLPPTAAGLPVPALALGAVGDAPLSARPTVLLLGGLDGVSLAGCEAVLASSAALLAQADHLPRGVAFVVVPWASPDALREVFEGRGDRGRDLGPLDDDGDGSVDEDGPDDVDGDGRILDMLIEDPAGTFARAADPRFLALARAGDAPRYILAREGRDADGDGRFNEDPAGGVCFDRAFPLGWKSERQRAAGAELPLEATACRALADLALERRTVLALLFQGDHGGLARPGSRRESPWPAEADAAAFDVAARAFSRASGRALQPPPPLFVAREGERPGAAIDWLYAVPGALALEVAAWGPAVERPPEAPGVGLAEARFDGPQHAPAHVGGPGAHSGTDGRAAAPGVSASDLAWARWLDNTRGGIGFVDWHPVELGSGRAGLPQALVGGWEPRSRVNPPDKSLAGALAGMPEFVLALALALPTLELRVLESSRDGEVCAIRARIANAGALPTSGWASGRASAGSAKTSGARLELELPNGARLLAGEPSVSLGEIAGGGASREVSWLVLAAPGTVMTLRASAPWTAGLSREVKP